MRRAAELGETHRLSQFILMIPTGIGQVTRSAEGGNTASNACLRLRPKRPQRNVRDCSNGTRRSRPLSVAARLFTEVP
jgi:hypothetical protein